jgi:signal transduction histidine kinase
MTLRIPPSLRFRVPLAVLLVSIGLVGVAALDALRTARSQQAVARRALQEYAMFAAWSFGQHLNESLSNLLRETLGAVNHGHNLHTSRRIPPARELAHYLPWDPSCECHRVRSGPNPETFFAFRIGSDSLEVAVNHHPRPSEGWEVDIPLPVPLAPDFAGPYSREDQQWILDTLTRRIRGAGEADRGFTLVVAHGGTRPRVIAYTLMPTSWGDTMVYGARYSPSALTTLLGDVLDGSGVLPASFTVGRRNRDVIVARVYDRHGDPIFDSAPGVSSPLTARLPLSPRVGALTVDALIRPELAGRVLIGGLPRSRMPFLIGLLGLAAALALVAVLQLRREEELTHMRADFVSSVSHELRTPLAQIRLYLETLRLGRAKSEAQREWSLGHIERETTRLSHLVENVLRFSGLGRESGVEATPLDVRTEVDRIVDEFRPIASSKRATLVVEAAGDAVLALRPDTLRHVLLNLLDNAVKYGPVGQTIRIRVETPGDEVRITVSDQGPGVPAREREAIWVAFTRGASSKAVGGSGIGLAIVRRLVEQHAGRCWVEADESGGARFVVALPMVAHATSSNGVHHSL